MAVVLFHFRTVQTYSSCYHGRFVTVKCCCILPIVKVFRLCRPWREYFVLPGSPTLFLFGQCSTNSATLRSIFGLFVRQWSCLARSILYLRYSFVIFTFHNIFQCQWSAFGIIKVVVCPVLPFQYERMVGSYLWWAGHR